VPKKARRLAMLSNGRGVGLSAALYNLYEAFMWCQLEYEMSPLPNCMVAYRVGRQILDSLYGISIWAARAEEWGLAWCLLTLDIKSAFDNTRQLAVAAALRRQGASSAAVAAWRTEQANAVLRPTFAGMPCPEVEMQKGLRTGGRGSPKAWNRLLAPLAKKAKRLWQHLGPAFLPAPELEEQTMLVYADNIILIGSNADLLCARAAILVRLFGEI
jgi:hypothetical protein